jgi:hypothetical protein
VFTAFDRLAQLTLAHEECHVLQYAQYGIIGYLARWSYWTLRAGYSANPFEVEAHEYATQVVRGAALLASPAAEPLQPD